MAMMKMSDSQKVIDADKSKSAKIFSGEVIPILEKLLDVKIISLESLKGNLPTMLDRQHGTDALLFKGDFLCGLSQRTQDCRDRKSFDTFTIRLEKENGVKTELSKRSAEISRKKYCPEYFVQTFLHSGDKISVGVGKTKEIIRLAKTKGRLKVNPKDETKFLYVTWQDVKDTGLFFKSVTQTRNKKSRPMSD